MKISSLEAIPVRVPYRRPEVSYLISRSGVTDVIVKLTTDDGLIGWGEACMNSDAATIVAAVEAARQFVVGRDPWDKEAMYRDFFVFGGWQWQPMTGNFAFAGIDMAMWDLCGKACGQPLYQLLGGAMREEVDYFYYLDWGTSEDMEAQCLDGKRRGYSVYYFKAGQDAKAEEEMLEVVRATLGTEARLRVDPNQAWTVPGAIRTIRAWDAKFDLDFVEAPVQVRPSEISREVKERTGVSLCANEGLWHELDAMDAIDSHVFDYLCFSPYYVGSIRRFLSLAEHAHRRGQIVIKHTHGEVGLAAAAGQHLMLAAANAGEGHQQTAQIMADDILTSALPIAEGPKWGRIEQPGLGVEVDEHKLMRYHDEFLRFGDFRPYGERFQQV